MYSAKGEVARTEVNAWIRSATCFDHVLDFDAVWRDPADAAQIRTDFAADDGLHGNDAGYAALAASIDLTMFE